MRPFLLLLIGLLSIAASGFCAEARASKEECVAFVKRAVQEIHIKGAEIAFTEFNDRQGAFISKDLYVISYNMAGVTLAHGGNPALVGRNRLDEQDADGVYYNREKIERAKIQSTFWQNYIFPDPLTHKILPKATYCEVTDDPAYHQLIVCAGIYLVDH